MRKIFSILILCTLLIYMGGYHLVYALHQAGLKKEMRVYLQNHHNEKYATYFKFKLDHHQVKDDLFEWEEENEEFRYRKEFYDIVTIEKAGDSLQICAIKDGRENELENQLQEICKTNHNKTGTPASSLVKFFSVFCFLSNTALLFPGIDNVYYPATPGKALLLANATIHKPPPRC